MGSYVRILGLVVLLPTVFGSPVPLEETAETTAEFQKELDRLREIHRFPGATAAFALSNGECQAFATGHADRELSVPMTTDSLQPIGGVGKTFTAAVILSLVQDGVLTLDDKVAKWLGKDRWIWRLPNHTGVTIRMLLNHSTGIPNHAEDDRFVRTLRQGLRANPDFRFTPEELVQFVLDKDALFAPGRGFRYSDTNYILAGLVIERATGSSYYGELVRRILTPLRLDLTGPADRRGLPSLATGYVEGPNLLGLPRKVVSRGMLVINPLNEWTGGGLVSSSGDLARWAMILYQGKALSEPYLDSMLDAVATSIKGQRYGLGVQIENSELGTLYGHDGSFPGYRSCMAYFPEHRVALALQINTNAEIDTRKCLISLARVVIGKATRSSGR